MTHLFAVCINTHLICDVPVGFVDGFLCCTEALQSDVVPLVYVCFCSFCVLVSDSKSHYQDLCQGASEELLPAFSSRSVRVWGLMFKSAIHFDLIFLYGVR